MGGERANIADLASQVSSDIFKAFKWFTHPAKDENYDCLKTDDHFPGKPDASHSHPTDVVFYYYDPYLGKNIYLLTDLKSYSDSTIKSNAGVRQSLTSLARSIDCARVSAEWKSRYVIEETPYDIRGFLFIYNHDNKYQGNFKKYLAGTSIDTIPIKQGMQIHLFGPEAIARNFAIAQDLARLSFNKELGQDYTYIYPELVQWRHHSDKWNQPATIESLTSPFLIIQYRNDESSVRGDGYIIYYTSPGEMVEEFIYLIDVLSRFQILNEGLPIRIRLTSPGQGASYLNNMERAKRRYLAEWGLDSSKETELKNITVGAVQAVLPNYSALEAGWDRSK